MEQRGKARCNYCWELDQWKMYSIIVSSFFRKDRLLKPYPLFLLYRLRFVNGLAICEQQQIIQTKRVR
ncbi:hypothetical protein PUN28_001655 [Cardiocondyla obscurior]|uniref:Uncharacterized protein n=1 Tax=Cardiocondyla obscurior TaxID=286306 RepID=A0AAW2GQM5_9HYME